MNFDPNQMPQTIAAGGRGPAAGSESACLRDCSTGVYNTGRAVFSLGCCGSRAYLDVLADDVALWGVLAPNLERIVALAQANAVLTTFPQLRRTDVEDGKSPTIKESLAAMASRN